MSELQPRIIGTETEYGLTPVNRPNIWHNLPPNILHLGEFLSNGSRFYVDTGDHPEYATPECTTVEQVVCHELAGEAIVTATLNAIAQKRVWHSRYRLNKRVIATSPQTWGAHENYSVQPFLDPAELPYTNALALHYISRNVFAGAGFFDGISWGVAQKLSEATKNTSSTAVSGPIVDTKNEPLADDETKWRRLQVSCGDANISPWALRMKLGTTAIFLKMLEFDRNTFVDLSLQDPLRSAWLTSADTSLQQLYQLKDGRKMTALNIQTELAIRARKASDRLHFTDEELEILAEWECACDDAARDPLLLDGRADWATKMVQAERLADGYSPKNRLRNLAALDLLYDQLGPKRGWGLKLRDRSHFEYSVPQEDIDKAMTTPPSTTRALLRGRAVSLAPDIIKQQGIYIYAEWARIGVRAESRHNDVPLDPLSTSNDDLEKLFARVAKPAKRENKKSVFRNLTSKLR